MEPTFVQEGLRHYNELTDRLALEDPVRVALVDLGKGRDLRLRLVLGLGHRLRAIRELLDLGRVPTCARNRRQGLVQPVRLRARRLWRRRTAAGERSGGQDGCQPATAHSNNAPTTLIPKVHQAM